MLTSIAPREQPAKGPTTALDQRICEVLGNGNLSEPREIKGVIPEATLQQIYARLRVLVDRGVLMRVTYPEGPRRGPGSGRYYKA